LKLRANITSSSSPTTTSVDLIVDADRVENAEVDESRLFGAGHNLEIDASLLAGTSDEVAAVRCLANGARRHGAQRRPVRVRDLVHAHETVHTALHRIAGDFFHVAAAATEADDLTFAGNHFETARRRFGND
jgi:hypothetical protein